MLGAGGPADGRPSRSRPRVAGEKLYPEGGWETSELAEGERKGGRRYRKKPVSAVVRRNRFFLLRLLLLSTFYRSGAASRLCNFLPSDFELPYTGF